MSSIASRSPLSVFFHYSFSSLSHQSFHFPLLPLVSLSCSVKQTSLSSLSVLGHVMVSGSSPSVTESIAQPLGLLRPKWHHMAFVVHYFLTRAHRALINSSAPEGIEFHLGHNPISKLTEDTMTNRTGTGTGCSFMAVCSQQHSVIEYSVIKVPVNVMHECDQ